MWRLQRNRDETGTPEGQALVAECQAFLVGGYVDYLTGADRPVPPWAWLNPLAHGSEEDVRELAERGPCVPVVDPTTAVWEKALSYLAEELQCLVASGGPPLPEVQRSSLVPLELELAGAGAEPLAPSDLVAAVMQTLQQFRAQRRRR